LLSSSEHENIVKAIVAIAIFLIRFFIIILFNVFVKVCNFVQQKT